LKSKVVTLLASWNIGGFPFVKATFNNRGIKLPVERNGRYFEPELIMDFYARYSKDGRRRPAPLGKDPVDALSGFESAEAPTTLGNTRLLPIHVQEKTSAGHKPAVCAKQF
jgi:hypothetical protein